MKITMTEDQLGRHVLTQVLDAQANLTAQLRHEIELAQDGQKDMRTVLAETTREIVEAKRREAEAVKCADEAGQKITIMREDLNDARARVQLLERERDELLAKDRIFTKDREDMMSELGQARRAITRQAEQMKIDAVRIRVQASNYQKLADRCERYRMRVNAARRLRDQKRRRP